MSEKVAETTKKPCCGGKWDPKPCKVTELPMYGNPYPPKDVLIDNEPGLLESGIRSARLAIQDNLGFLDGAIDRTKQIVSTSVEHSKATIDLITAEGNDGAKAGAIAVGGLFGLLLAARRGIIKKTLYMSLGAGTVASVCYPQKASEYGQVTKYILKNKAPVLIKEYTGVDVNDLLKVFLKTQKEEKAKLDLKDIPKTRDQSKPEDGDMYSNRSSK